MSHDDDIDEQAWQLLIAHLQEATPQQRHLFAARSNYDDNHDALQWLADDPRTEHATALLMYWSLGAEFHTQYATDDEVPGWARSSHRLIRQIEERCLTGFYASGTLYFDPRHGPVPPGDYADVEQKRPIPPAMLAAVMGNEEVDLDDEHYDEGLPMAVADAIWALYQQDR